MGAAANAVHRLMGRVKREWSVPAAAVKGISMRHYKTLGRNSLEYVEHATLVAECNDANIALGRADMGS